jgi:hypothetical protein
VALGIIRKSLTQLGYEKRAFWTRSDKTHVAAQDVQDLCQFVDAKLSDDCAHPRNAGIAFGRPARTAVGLGVGPHAAEFENREDAAMQSDPVLAVEDRTGALEFDQAGRQNEQRQRQDQQTQAYRDIEGPL